MKWVPVRTPRGSAFIGDLGFPATRGSGHSVDHYSLAVDGEVWAVHPAKIAATALFGCHHVWWMITLRVESGGERQDLGGTELNAKPAGLTTLHDDRNTTLCHGSSGSAKLRAPS